jgi:D-sedoheptulose 7-phosphate isomerase
VAPWRSSTARPSASTSGGRRLAEVLVRGSRLLAVGNGGSAAEAQHLTSELVGRYRDDRPPFSAIALCAETSSLTAIGNDYGVDRIFARQVRVTDGRVTCSSPCPRPARRRTSSPRPKRRWTPD